MLLIFRNITLVLIFLSSELVLCAANDDLDSVPKGAMSIEKYLKYAEDRETIDDEEIREHLIAYVETLFRQRKVLIKAKKTSEVEANCMLLYDLQLKLYGNTYKKLKITMNWMDALAFVYESKGEEQESLRIRKKCMDLRSESLGPNHPDVLRSLIGLGDLNVKMENLETAESNYLDALNLARDIDGRNSYRTFLKLLQKLTKYYTEEEMYDKNEPLIKEDYLLRFKLSGEGDLIALKNMQLYGITLQKLERPDEAAEIFVENLELIRKTQGDDSKLIVASISRLAMIYHDRGNYIDAQPLMQTWTDLCINHYGEAHSRTRKAKLNLAINFEKLGNEHDASLWRKSADRGLSIEKVKEQIEKNLSSGKASVTDTTVLSEESNIKLVIPGQWESKEENDPSNPREYIAMRRYNKLGLDMFMEAFSSHIGIERDYRREEIVDYLKSLLGKRLQANVNEFKVLKVEDYACDGVDGLVLNYYVAEDSEKKRVEGYFSVWAGVKNGYLYQIIIGGSVPKALKHVYFRQRDEALNAFRVVVGDKVASEANTVLVADDFHSNKYAYSFEGSKLKGWRNAAEPDAVFKGAEIAYLLDWGRSASLAIFSVYTGDLEISDSVIEDVFLSILKVNKTSQNVEKLRLVENGGKKLSQFKISTGSGDDAIDYLLSLEMRNQLINMILVRYVEANVDDEMLEEINSAHKYFKASELPEDLLDFEFSDEELKAQASMLNLMAVFYQSQSDIGKSEPIMKLAVERYAEDLNIYFRYIDTLAVLKKYKKFESLLSEAFDRFPDSYEIKTLAGRVYNERGNKAVSRKYYEEAIEGGEKRFEKIEEYLLLLHSMSEYEKGLEIVEKFNEEGSSVSLMLYHSLFLRRLDRHQEGEDMLMSVYDDNRRNSSYLSFLFELLIESGKYEQVLELFEELKEDDIILNQYAGRANYMMRDYDLAKKYFEQALIQNPADSTSSEYLDLISSYYAKRANIDIKTEIMPVEYLLDSSEDVEGLIEENSEYFEESGAYYQYHGTATYFKPNERQRVTYYRKVKITHKSGIQRYSDMQFAFEPVHEKIYINLLRVIDRNGDVVFEGSGDIDKVYVLEDSDGSVTTNSRTLHIPIIGLSVGSTVELIVSKVSTGIDVKRHFRRTFFSRSIPVVKSFLYLVGDMSDMAWEVKNIDCDPVVEDDSILWEINMPRRFYPETYLPRYDTYTPSVSISDKSRTWQELAKEYCDDIKEYFEIDADAKGIYDKLFDGVSADSDEEKLNIISSYISDEYTYKAILFGRQYIIPNDLGAIIERKFGDCKDHAVLLIQLLKAAGINALPALVNSSSVYHDTPSLYQFNHMIVYLPDFRGGRFLDPTQKYVSYLKSPPYLGGMEGFILDSENSRFKTISNDDEFRSIVSDRKVEVAEDLSLNVVEELSIEGFTANYLRKVILESEKERAIKYFIYLLENDAVRIELNSLETENERDFDQPLIVKLEYGIKDAWNVIDGKRYIELPALLESKFLSIDSQYDRKSNFEIDTPYRFSSRIEVMGLDGVQLRLPEAVSRKDSDYPFVDYKFNLKQDNGSFTIEADFQQVPGVYDAKKFSSFREASSKFIEMIKVPVQLR